MRPDDLQRVKLAAEESAWLIERGYDALDVSAFVAKRRALSEDERRLLDCSTRSGTNVKHHIARELDPEDVRKRPLRVDVESTLCAVASATQGAVMLQSAAGLLCDPLWRRGEHRWDEGVASAFARCCEALTPLKPKEIRWLVRGDWEPAMREAWALLAKRCKLRGEVVVDHGKFKVKPGRGQFVKRQAGPPLVS